MIGAAFRMSNDHVACARIAQHLRADIAGVSARGFGVAVLPADPDSVRAGGLNRSRDKRCRRTDEDLAPIGNRPHRCQIIEEAERVYEANS